jgi:hypothetical protein
MLLRQCADGLDGGHGAWEDVGVKALDKNLRVLVQVAAQLG